MNGEEQKKPEDLKTRTRRFALRIVRLYSALPKTTLPQIMGKQLLRAGTSVGAHYREGLRARSKAEIVSKLGGALQELEETAYWLELLTETGLVKPALLKDLAGETDELIAILTVCAKKMKPGNASA
jgi:four helix bundle protein